MKYLKEVNKSRSALFLVPTLTSAYHQNRAEEIHKLGVECHVAAFERTYYPGKSWGFPVQKIGFIEHERYYKRLFVLVRSLSAIREASKGKTMIFTFNLDLLFLVYLALIGIKKKPLLIYDVSDIRSVLIGNGLLSRILRAIERFLLRRTAMVIVPSEAYIDHYFHAIQNHTKQNFHLIENKLNPGSTPDPLNSKGKIVCTNPPAFTIGYFGLIRCRKSLHFLIKLAHKAEGRIRIVIRGIFLTTEDLQKEIEEHPFMDYLGTYVNPDDLAKIHDEVDFSWLVHAHSLENTKWSRIFRFYHAAHYHCPMIAQVGSQDGIEIDRLNLGFTVNIFHEKEAMDKILSVTQTEVIQWINNLENLPDHVTTITNEYDELLTKLFEQR